MADHAVPCRARGERPCHFDGTALDQSHAIILALAAEHSVTPHRLDLIERVLDAREILNRVGVGAIELTVEVESERQRQTDELVRRVFRVVKDDRDALESDGVAWLIRV